MNEKFEYQNLIFPVEELQSKYNFIIEREGERGIIFRNLDDRSVFLIKTNITLTKDSNENGDKEYTRNRMIDFHYKDVRFISFIIGDGYTRKQNPNSCTHSMDQVCETIIELFNNQVDDENNFDDQTEIVKSQLCSKIEEELERKVEFLKKEEKECETIEEVYEQNGQKLNVKYDVCCAEALKLFHGVTIDGEIKKTINEERGR